ncbi:MAG: hypothetical protein HRU19_32030 [Pseudobacteriovorax sp.]|nr:hypothetical protein [Pseudobacteriovorax sp.]
MASKNNENRKVSVAIPFLERKVDPVSSFRDSDNLKIRTIYSGLVDSDPITGEVVSGLAKKFYWEGNELVFELREKFFTRSGHEITSHDVAFSVSRSLTASDPVPGSLHLRIKKDVKGEYQISKTGKYKVRIGFKEKIPSLVSLFEHPKLFIVPKVAFSKDSKTIIDYRNTTGPYYIEKKSDKTWTLKQNKGHWKIKSYSPAEVNVVSDIYEEDGKESISKRLFKVGAIDHIPMSSIGSPNRNLNDGIADSQIHIASHSSMMFMFFSELGMKLDLKTRLRISNLLRKEIKRKLKMLKVDREPALQLTMPFAFGSLNKSQLAEIKKQDSLDIDSKSIPKIRISTLSHAVSYYQEMFSRLGDRVEVVSISDKDYEPFSYKSKDDDGITPHLVMSAKGLEEFENLESIDNLLRNKIFSIRDDLEIDNWIEAYYQTDESHKRQEMLRSLHFKSLTSEVSVVPMFSIPKYGFSRNGWRMNFPKRSVIGSLTELKYGK